MFCEKKERQYQFQTSQKKVVSLTITSKCQDDLDNEFQISEQRGLRKSSQRWGEVGCGLVGAGSYSEN